MASIRKLSNGSYQAEIFLGRDANGKQIKKYITRNSQKELKLAVRDFEIEWEENNLLDVKNIWFEHWCDKWLEMKKPKISSSTYVSYKMYIETHFKPYFKRFKLFQINSVHIEEYISIKLNDKLSPVTVRKHLFVLSELLQTALKGKNPCIDIKPPKTEKYAATIPTEEEFTMIFNKVKGTDDEIPILLAAWCGMRQGEIFALKWNDIDFENEIVTIDENRAISIEGYKDKSPKSDRGKRKLSIPEYLLEILQGKYNKIKNQLPKEKLIDINNIKNNFEDQYLFDIRPDSYSKRFAKLMDSLGLPKVRFHDLRHYHATILFKAGIPDQYAAQRLGHDIMVLKKIYQHLQLDDKKQLDDKVKNIFKKLGE